MAGERKRIGLREVRALGPGAEVWDAAVPGFGARRQRSPAVSYIVLYRTVEGRSRRFTIGRHGAPWTPETARAKALDVLIAASKGSDPAGYKREKREAASVAELCDAYMADAEAGRLLTRRGASKKASTLATDRSRIAAHIRPLLGSMKVAAITSRDVEAFMHAVAEGRSAHRSPTGRKRGLSNVRGGKGAASRTVGLLGALFTYGVKQGMRHDNPVTGTDRFAYVKRERRLTDAEYAALGTGLAAVSMWPDAIACARFLALTGWRSGEALGLRWRDVDLGKRTARLADTKSGVSVRPLSHAALAVLTGQGGGKPDVLVFRASRGEGAMTGFPGFFERIAKAAGLPADVTPHVLRHSFASLANDLGLTAATIGMLIGHRGSGTTRGYIHGADAVLLAAADKVADGTSERMGEERLIADTVSLRAEAVA
jgi:integrase